MTTKTDALASSPGSPSQRSMLGVISDHPILFAFALAAGAALLGGTLLLFDAFSDSEEATIRVRNGSLEFIILHPNQEWTPAGGSGNYRNRDGEKHTDTFEVVVVPAGTHTCNLYSRTGSDIEFTYSDDKKILVQSQNKNTFVKPGTGVNLTWDQATPRVLTYTPAGYLSRVTVDGQTLCTFTSGAQLSSVLILNVP
jgi:hypothetical protein